MEIERNEGNIVKGVILVKLVKLIKIFFIMKHNYVDKMLSVEVDHQLNIFKLIALRRNNMKNYEFDLKFPKKETRSGVKYFHCFLIYAYLC